MDDRIARLRTSLEARRLAENARRLGNLEIEDQALKRASELKALEDGFTSPAQQAIAVALYAYEEEQTRLKGRTFRAHRTRQMLTKHGALAAAERMVLHRQPSKGYEFLEEVGLQQLSFEAIISNYPDEFSVAAVEAARVRLHGTSPTLSAASSSPALAAHGADAPNSLVRLDAEALAFLAGFHDPSTWFRERWLPRYRATTQTIEQALQAERPQDLIEILWKRADNSISHAGQGQLKFEAVERMRGELIQVICDIHLDGSPENFERIVERFEGWKAEGRIPIVPRLLIARAFAGIHPRSYHTTVDTSSQNQLLKWFVEHTGFVISRTQSWAGRAKALVTHLDRADVFGEDILARNIFPWFVMEQLRARTSPADIPPGHTPRPETAFANLPPARRAIELRHNALQSVLFALLAGEFGADKVWTEYPTGTGGYADAIARRLDGRCYLYEIKVADTADDVVRQAMGQLLEYGYRAGGLEPVKLVVVGEPAVDDVTHRFLDRLRADFNLEIEYMQIGLLESEQPTASSTPEDQYAT